MMEENKYDLGRPLHVFRIRHRYTLVYWAFLCLLISGAFVYLIIVTPEEPLWRAILLLITILVMLFLAWKNIWRMRNTRYTIYASGLCLDEFEHRVCTPWENLKAIQPSPGQSLLFKEPVDLQLRFPWLGKPLNPQIESVPIWAFVKTKNDDGLIPVLREYAPHLFAGEEDKVYEQ